MFVLTRPAITAISHFYASFSFKRAKLEGLASDNLDWLGRLQSYEKKSK